MQSNTIKITSMRNTFILLALLFSNCMDHSENVAETPKHPTDYRHIGSVEVLDESLFNIIAQDAPIEILAEGFTWSEGPVWVEEINSLLFSDVPENRIWQWSESDSLELFLEPSGYLGEGKLPEGGSNGLLLNADGKLILCQHGERQVAQLDAPYDAPKPSFTSLASAYKGKRFNSPNDLVFDKNGNLYFTDPPYGLPQQMADLGKELDFQGVFRRNTDASVDLIIDSLTRPNGIELSPDGKTLYVAVSDPAAAHIMAYDLSEDGNASNARILVDATPFVGKTGMNGLPDGMVVNAAGIIFATAPGGVWVITPEGKVLGRILTTQATANCTLSPDEKTLYMTADMYLLRVQLL